MDFTSPDIDSLYGGVRKKCLQKEFDEERVSIGCFDVYSFEEIDRMRDEKLTMILPFWYPAISVHAATVDLSDQCDMTVGETEILN